jgi:hypothetical protein
MASTAFGSSARHKARGVEAMGLFFRVNSFSPFYALVSVSWLDRRGIVS